MAQLLARLQDALTPTFWPSLAFISVVLVVLSIRTQKVWIDRSRKLIPRDWGLPLCLAVAAPIIFAVVRWSDFGYHDDDTFFNNSLVGHRFALGIWPGPGRYFPLYAQEFNLLGKISATRGFYYGLIAVQLAIFVVVVNSILAELRPVWRAAGLALMLWASATTILFIEAVYPERNVVFLMALFILALQRFDRKATRLNMAVALVAAFLALYFKETVVLFVGIVALVRILKWKAETKRPWSSVHERPLELALLGACLVFAIQLGILVAGPGGGTYVTENTIGPSATLLRYLRIEPLLFVFAGAIVMRLIELRRTRTIDGVWDACAIASVVYLLGLVATGLAADRYMGPVLLVAAMFSVRVASNVWSSRVAARPAIALVLSAVLVLTVASGAMRIVEHTSVVDGTVKLADFMSDYANAHPGQVEVYFPDTAEFRIMNFAAVLQYRHPGIMDRVRLKAPHPFPDGRCVDYVDYACTTAESASPGDLVVQLPDDPTRSSDEAEHNVVFDHTWLGSDVPPLLGSLYYPQMPLYTSGAPMPNDWLHVTVSVQPG